jgi:P27 family predicted phage terminase small subunit
MARGRKPNPKSPPVPVVADGSGPYCPPEPPGLGKRAQAKWRAIVPLIAQQVALKEVDADALRQYCEAVVLREKAVAELEDAPLLMSGPNGAEYANPLMKIITQQESLMMKMAERFGLDPSSRRRLMIETVKADTAFSEFMKRGRERPKPAVEGA